MRYLISALFALMVPILSVVALAVALSYGEAGATALLTAVVGYGLLTEFHVRRRANASSLLETPTPGWLLQVLNVVSSRGELEFAIGGRIRWSLPNDGHAAEAGPRSGVQGNVRVQVRSSREWSGESSRLGTADIMPGQPPASTAPVDSLRILIVANDDRYLTLIAELLRVHGAHHVSSSTTDDAVDVVERDCPEVVILDLDAEGSRTGRTILELLSLLPTTKDTPIIGLTWNRASTRGSRDWLQEHHIRILHKPFDPSDLYGLLHAAAASSGTGNPHVDGDWSFGSKS